MKTLDAIAALIPTLAGRISAGAGASDVQAVVERLADDAAVAALEEISENVRLLDQLRLIVTGVIAGRSTREAGHGGLAQSRGYPSAVSLVQQVTGVTKTEAARQVRVGEALLDDAPVDDVEAGGLPAEQAASVAWRQVLRDGLRSGAVTSAQFDAIRRGLGDPPEGAEEAWVQAAGQLIEEAGRRTVEELAAAARTVRDLLDPDGAEARFLARYEKRAFRTWFDQDGMRRASIAFDDEGGAYLDTIFTAALRPRRGGPRFVDPTEKTSAAELVADPRTNDQLSYDLLLDLIRTGALADPTAVFGTRQAGLRLVQQIADGAPNRVAVTEDGLHTVPAAVAERRICDTGTIPVTVDACGNPLDVGRESRLFTPKQRIGLAVRDGGCRWNGCDRPASYCEAHHIDEWARDDGRTDIDRGTLLCRFHHMQLHHGRWQITRDGKDDFVLHHPDRERSVLHPRLPLRYAWGDIDPPPKRFHPAA
ncbi:HNH endonuclease signature motif containing protein [Microbacterium sp. MYb64]|uniref:HNH endonuclease signature motif containing protein n=1 Tax=Microbacterium sp. MYb64 TaxID=1848691 RepID=UPI000CFC301C|nr:HNH endonuclease signature motif containing protein [Microbacterium sp. MYb64]PRB02922.1 HNH endonuclease [Microbacterium sp. MYb64]